MKLLSIVATLLLSPVLAFTGLCLPSKPSACCSARPALVTQTETDLDALAEQVIAPYVEVRTELGIGSGTVIEVDGEKLVLTAGHVVESCVRETKSVVKDKDGKDVGVVERKYQPVRLRQESSSGVVEVKATIILYSPVEEQGGHDLALLRPFASQGLKSAKFSATAKLQAGRDCWYVGTPMGLHRSLEKSIINRVDWELYSNLYTITNGHGTFGNSGGGLFVRGRDGDYFLVGVLVMTANNSPKHPIVCESQATIAAFLKLHKK